MGGVGVGWVGGVGVGYGWRATSLHGGGDKGSFMSMLCPYLGNITE